MIVDLPPIRLKVSALLIIIESPDFPLLSSSNQSYGTRHFATHVSIRQCSDCPAINVYPRWQDIPRLQADGMAESRRHD